VDLDPGIATGTSEYAPPAPLRERGPKWRSRGKYVEVHPWYWITSAETAINVGNIDTDYCHRYLYFVLLPHDKILLDGFSIVNKLS